MTGDIAAKGSGEDPVSERRRASRGPGRGIAFRLSLWILCSAAVIFTGAIGYYYALSRRVIVEKIERHASEMAKGTAARIDTPLAAMQKIPENLAVFIAENRIRDVRELVDLMNAVVERNQEIYGTAVAFAPLAWDGKSRHLSPYVYRKNGGTASSFITYDYFTWEWYRLPARRRQALWVEPYFDEGAGNIIMSTYSVPLERGVRGARTFSGVVTVDVSLERLREMVSGIQIGSSGYAFLISKRGTFVTHPDERLIMNKTISDLADELGDANLRALGVRMMAGETGIVESRDVLDGGKCWLAFAPLATTGWSVGVVFPRDELMRDVYRHSWITLLLGVLGLAILCALIAWIARGITRPLSELTAATKVMAAGDLDVAIPVIRSRDEVGSLALSVGAMQKSLKEYIRDLTQTTAAKERIEGELKIAHDIQMGMLPRVFPPFPRRKDVDIYATLEPAKEVGGDLYDFFLMDEEHVCFTVGDVSGKGVPAALLMAVTKILVKTKGSQGLAAEVIVSRVNEDLSLDNPSMMFVTLFLGVLNLRTGEVVYCNAGHPPPYLLRQGGELEKAPVTGGMALGVDGDFIYRSERVTLRDGDALLLYSDGVTEATDARGEFFGETRLEEVLGGSGDRSPNALVARVVKRLEDFAGEAPQADDITLMAVTYFGENGEGRGADKQR